MQTLDVLTDKQLIADARKTLTLREFANLLGVSYGAVFQWETGETRPSLPRIKAWACSPNPEVSALGKALFALRKTEAEAEFKL